MAVTMTKLAEEVGVSVAVVSRFLRNDPTLRISESRRRQIIEARDRLGGVKVSRINTQKLTKRIVVPASRVFSRNKQFIAETDFCRSFEDELKSHNFQVNYVFYDPGQEVEAFKDLIVTPGACDGLLILGGGSLGQLAGLLQLHNFPHISSSEDAELFNLNTVRTHTLYGLRLAVKHLYDLGHRNIGYIGTKTTGSLRYSLFVAQLVDFGLKINEKHFFNLDHSGTEVVYPEQWAELAREIFLNYFKQDMENKPTAFLCSNDIIALGVIDALEANNIKPGKDISLVGYDNYEQRVLKKDKPVLTTIDNPRDIVGRRAAIRLLNQIVHRQMQITQERIPTSLIVRETTGPCKK